jgi:hypothetical protein
MELYKGLESYRDQKPPQYVDENEPVGTSHDALGNGIQELVARRLQSGQNYIIVVNFSDDDGEDGSS